LADPGQQPSTTWSKSNPSAIPQKSFSGTTQITRSPDRLRIAEFVGRFLRDAGIMKNGFSFQAGAGGIALAFVDYSAA